MSIYPELSYNDQKVEIQDVKGIQFSVLGPNEIISRSVAEINRTDTYTGNEPVVGGLFDSRMGILEHNKICSTCEQKNIFCPGHFGHIVLAKPVFHAMFFDITRKILKCVCFRCSKMLISPQTTFPELKQDITKIMATKDNQQRWSAYYKLCNNNTKIKCCGDDGSVGCGAKQPSKYNKDGPMKIIAEWKDKVGTDETKPTMEFTPEDVLRVFKRISEEDMEIMGFNPLWNRPEWMISTVIPVPPPAVRPSIVEENGQRREDDLTHKLSEIIKTNNNIIDRIAKKSSEETIKLIAMALQFHVYTLIDNQISGLPPSQHRNGRKLKSVSDRMKKKEGRIRGNLNGKRVDQSARTVITPDPYISIDELGVPVKIAINITFPEIVNEFNIDNLKKLIKNGPENWPGAKYIKKQNDSVTINIKYATNEIDKVIKELKYGDIVHRHLADGDYILFNRQPSLHKMSMMCHKVVVMPYQTFRLNVLDTPPYNADFDGDEMNMHCPQNIQTMSELRDIAAVPYMVLAPRDGKPIIEIVQDTLLGSFRLTKDYTEIGDKNMANLQMINSYFTGKLEKPKNDFKYSGKEAYSYILPPGLNISRKNKADEKFIIKNSRVENGTLDKTVFHGITSGLIPVIYHDYGPFEVRKFLDNTQRLMCRWLLTSGFSVGISDLITDTTTDTNLKNKIKEMKTIAYEQLDEVRRGIIENNSIFNNADYTEREIIGILNETTNQVGKIGLSQIDERTNRMINMVKCGSKGKETNVAQIIACVGQQNVDGKRISYGFTDRTLPHFTKYDDGPDARGFVERSFIDGLSPHEVFFHAMGGREGLIDTAVKSVTGDTPIIIIEDGEAKTVNIGDWIDAKMNKEENKELVEQFGPEDANMEMMGVSNNIYMPACDYDGNIVWGKVTNVSRHDPGDILYKVTTKGGRYIKVTKSKSIIVWKDGKFEPIETPNVKIGDCIPVTMNLPEPPVINEFVDMVKYFPKTEYVYGTDLHKARDMITSLKKLPSGWWEANNGSTFTLPYPDLRSFRRTMNERGERFDLLKEGHIYNYRTSVINYHIPEKFELNKENGIFIGLFLADGNTRIKQGDIGITKNNESVISFVKKWFDKYSINWRIDDRTENRKYRCVTIIGQCTIMAKILTNLVGHGASEKRVPDCAFTAPKEFAEGIINGYFSGDGNIDTSTKTINANSISKEMINGISMLCSRFGIFGKMSIIEHEVKVDKLIQSKKTAYKISIRAQWAKKFQNIGLINDEKNSKLQGLDIAEYDHKNFKYNEDSILDEVISIEEIPKDVVDAKYHKAYDVSIPECGNFSTRYGAHMSNTSETGYIQRRLVKAMEDAKVYYDNTVRNTKGSIVQFIYGEDGMDGCKIESHYIPIIQMNSMDIDLNYCIRENDRLKHYITSSAFDTITSATYERCAKHYQEILDDKEFLIDNVFKGTKTTTITYPIPFDRIIKNANNRLQNMGIKSIQTDLTPDHVLDTIDKLIEELYIKDTTQGMRFFHILLRLSLSPKKMLIEYHFTVDVFDWIVSQIKQYFIEAISQPGEMVGIVAAQTIGEMGTQMTLDSFHVSGTDAAVKATSGVPRLKEILSATKKTKTPTLAIYMKHDIATVINPVMEEDGIETKDERVEKAKSVAINIKNSIEITKLSDILEYSEIYWDNGKYETSVEKDKGLFEIYNEFKNIEQLANKCKSDSPWVLRMKFNKEKMNFYGLRMIDIYTKLNMSYDKYIDCVYSDDNAEECIFRIKLTDVALKDIDANDELASVKAIEHNIVYQVLLKGYKGIKKVSLNKKKYEKYNKTTQNFDKVIEWVLDTDGTNLIDILSNPNIDATRTISNDIREIYETLGIEAARNALHDELINVTSEGSMNYRHLSLLIDVMTYKGYLISIDRHGINRGDIGPLAKSSFEETTDMLVNASIFAQYDNVNGVSANVMLGQQPPCGTGDFNILFDEEHLVQLIKNTTVIPLEDIEEIEDDDNDCQEDDIVFDFTMNEPHKCFKLEEQKVKII